MMVVKASFFRCNHAFTYDGARNLRDEAKRFLEEATRREEDITRIECQLPIRKMVEVMVPNNTGELVARRERVTDTEATAAARDRIGDLRDEIGDLREEVDELRSAAKLFDEEVYKLDRATRRANELFIEMFSICQQADALGNSTILTYDSLDRITRTTNPLGHSKHFAYDAIGNITSITDENSNITQYRYSPLGDIVEVIDATGHSTKYSYDAARCLTELQQFNNLSDPQITTYHRNKKGEVISTTSPLGDMVKYTYDPIGNVTSMLDEDSLETLYAYNLAGKLANITYADGKTVAFTYNALKQLTEMQDWLGTTTIEMDALGRTTKTTDYEGNQVGYTYNAAGQREKLTYPDGKEVAYAYNASGRLSKVLAGTDTTTYTYDPLGRISERILPDKTTTKYEFNPLGAISSLTHSKSDENSTSHTILDQFKYTHDPVGNITAIEKHRTGIESDNGLFNYTYDPLNRLTKATRTAHNTHAPQSTKTYTYDPLSNRIASQQNGIETRHTFNARNQLITTFEGNDVTNHEYDNRGNLTQINKNGQLSASYTFDATNMMVAAHNPAKGTAEYTYDGFRNRVKKLENLHNPYNPYNPQQATDTNLPDPTKEIRYVLDMTLPYDNLLMTQGQSAQNQSYVWGDSLLSATANDNTLHYLQDHLGSPIRLSDNNINNTDTPLAYDEFGVPTVNAMSNTTPFGFTGYQIDNISGMQYAQARYYAPTIGRFVTEDPIKDRLNWYGYCEANPVTFVDPMGLAKSAQLNRSVPCDGANQVGAFNPVMMSVFGLFAQGNMTGIGSGLARPRSFQIHPPITMTRDGDNVSICVVVNIGGNGADLVIPGSDNVTFRQAIVSGIENQWGGDRGGLNVTVNITDIGYGEHLLRHGQRALSVNIVDDAGRSNRSGSWSLNNPGLITIYTSFRDGRERSVEQVERTAAHEFGHAIGVLDGIGFGYEGNTRHGDIISLMSSMWDPQITGATRLDIELAWHAQTTGRRRAWTHRSIRALIDTYGITR